ncbi:hypothetical protein GGR08_000518 [Bartonella fuyuanensis]|uniref:Uncharacterized protein n=1 Tax=Bartonella fuyuanensis TaxID=1460968 RepID=A0A840DXH7_9HYPH|nr:hypothetical protein [Bartonella fuyuanensis]MBB4076225.1 hypothetical protein [Bartonella fuyuanensis]
MACVLSSLMKGRLLRHGDLKLARGSERNKIVADNYLSIDLGEEILSFIRNFVF